MLPIFVITDLSKLDDVSNLDAISGFMDLLFR